MATMVMRHDVNEYGTWKKAVYDSVDSLRAQYGCTAQRVLRLPENANSLLVLREFPSLEKAPRIELWEDANV